MKSLTPRRRKWIVLLLSASIGINLVDRQALSVVAPVLRAHLSLSNTQYSYIIFGFQLGMLLGQLPAGLLLDRVGAKLGFIFIFTAWSSIDALHGLSSGLASLIGLRFLLGLAECGNYSGGIKVIASLFPAERRAFAGGVFNGGAQLGAVLAPPIIVFITIHWGWRAAFIIPSLLGLLWLLPWTRTFPREREGLATVSEGKPEFTSGRVAISPKRLLHNRQVLGLMLFRALTGPLTSFYWYWLPEYLRHGRGMSLLAIGVLAWIPYVGGGAGNVAGGYVSDFLIKRGASEDAARKISFVAGAMFSSLSLTLPWIRSTALAIGAISVIVFGNQWMAATYIGMVGDIFPSEIVGTVNGMGGVADSGMGMVTMLLVGIVIDHFSYAPVLVAAGVFPALAALAVFAVIGKITRVEIAR